jgi:site-specific DNA-methyltransferase (adenine-specific)
MINLEEINLQMLTPSKHRLSFYNKLYLGSACDMKEIPNNSVHLIMTSPPYFEARMDYQKEIQTLDQYLSIINKMILESIRVLVSGGRLVINIANVGRDPYTPITSYIHQMTEFKNLLRLGEIVWDKGASAGNSTAWGSWKSASCPSLRDVHEYLLVFAKDRKKRTDKHGIDTIRADSFGINTQSVWHIPSTSAKKRKHPAPFPVELARRVIELYSFRGDIVLDPFIGSGTTAEAAAALGRKYVGYDINKEYLELAKTYINPAKGQ